MKVSIIKRIEALEKQILLPEAAPDLIMIHYDNHRKCWIAGEHFSNGETVKTKEKTFSRLQDYCFSANSKGRVILDTFASPEPEEEIFQNLFCFNMAELRADLRKPADIYISKVTHDEDETVCQIIPAIRE